MPAAIDISTYPIHLGLGARSIVQPEFTGDMQWYAAYTERIQNDGNEGRLVSMFTFTRSWDTWEMHPQGSEVVLCTSGAMTLHQERADESKATVTLTAGQYAINEPGTWHTADVSTEATAVFITSGIGTQIRPR
jgi:mannose-6-phosphate isomerase-like protein (cupin superfamily)